MTLEIGIKVVKIFDDCAFRKAPSPPIRSPTSFSGAPRRLWRRAAEHRWARLDRQGGRQSRRLKGMCSARLIPVFENKLFVSPKLVELENVVLMPHTKSVTQERCSAIGELVIGKPVAHFAGQPLITPRI